MWPIFDSTQSRDFRKVKFEDFNFVSSSQLILILFLPQLGIVLIFLYWSNFDCQVVQGIISELESQGALPRSNSRVSSLATCCGPRLVDNTYCSSAHFGF